MINLDHITFKETSLDEYRSAVTAELLIRSELIIDRRNDAQKSFVEDELKRMILMHLYGDLRKLMPEILSIAYEVAHPINPCSKVLYEKLEELAEKLKAP